ncbi:Cholesterol oxidase [Bertholletia excelsa]
MAMAGTRVCLVEKGRRWESKDFPADSLSIMSAVRMENRKLGVSFGSKDALFQVYCQGDSLAAVACGLGGGSLVNAGVMLPTPPRARRNPKWPKEWERDWQSNEASASSMLRIQSIPNKFPKDKIMAEVAGEELKESYSNGEMKLSVNFDIEANPSNSKMGSCLACGNCLAGCPYNAKNSTDKTYLVSAVQAGCTVKTECQVKYVVENPDYTKQERTTRKRRRRWLVFLNEIDFLESDFVILSAGVFGTAEILFRSQLRGLRLSDKLGFGFSCNGNNVACLAGSSAPLSSYGLDKNNLSKMSFNERPGPSISSSYTSSLGFTIQSAVLPTAYPYLLFKGITTYGLPCSFWFLHGLVDKMKNMLGLKASKAMILNAMGYDQSDGKITFEKEMEEIRFHPPHDLLLPRKIESFQKLTKKLGGILFMSRYRSTAVHLLGGCNASSDPSQGVCNPYGQVFDRESQTHPGLYVCDASLIPCSVGINPCLTIATLAEHISRHLVKDVLEYKSEEGTISNQKPGSITSMELKISQRSSVSFKETMRGYIGGMPCTAYLKLQINSETDRLDRKNTFLGASDDSDLLLRGKVGGYIVLRALEMDKLQVIKGEVDLCVLADKTPYSRYMRYSLLLAASSGSRYVLEGRKVMNPYLFALYAWRETTTMHVTFKKVLTDSSKEEVLNLKGKLSITIVDFLRA